MLPKRVYARGSASNPTGEVYSAPQIPWGGNSLPLPRNPRPLSAFSFTLPPFGLQAVALGALQLWGNDSW